MIIVGLSQGYDEVVLRGNPESRSFSAWISTTGEFHRGRHTVNALKDQMAARKLVVARSSTSGLGEACGTSDPAQDGLPVAVPGRSSRGSDPSRSGDGPAHAAWTKSRWGGDPYLLRGLARVPLHMKLPKRDSTNLECDTCFDQRPARPAVGAASVLYTEGSRPRRSSNGFRVLHRRIGARDERESVGAAERMRASPLTGDTSISGRFLPNERSRRGLPAGGGFVQHWMPLAGTVQGLSGSWFARHA